MTPYPRTRFAPSPTGRMHLGHAYAAWFAWQSGGGRMVLRLEDIDRDRCRPEYEAGILEDLEWLGLWRSGDELYRQTDNRAAHQEALDRLRDRGLLYPCFCTRKEILEQAARSVSAPHGPDGPVYPGTCRRLSSSEAAGKISAGAPHVWRIDIGLAAAETGELFWEDREAGRLRAEPEMFGDVVLARKFGQFSYHLCCVVDDASEEIGLVTRGRDLLTSTHVHRLLQAALDLPVPEYHHHGLVVDETGQRLAKRTDALSIKAMRDQGWAAGDLLREAQRRIELPGRLGSG